MWVDFNSVNDSHFLFVRIKSNARLYEKLLLPAESNKKSADVGFLLFLKSGGAVVF